MVLSSGIRAILATSKFSSLGMRLVADNGGGKVSENETFREVTEFSGRHFFREDRIGQVVRLQRKLQLSCVQFSQPFVGD